MADKAFIAAARGTIFNTTAPTINWDEVPLAEYDRPESELADLLRINNFKYQGHNHEKYQWSNAETRDAMYQVYLNDLRDLKMIFIMSQKGDVKQWCPDCNCFAYFNFTDCIGKCTVCQSSHICYILESERTGDCSKDIYSNWDTFHRVVIESIIQDDDTFKSHKKHRNFNPRGF
jgi:hypothetical protein